MKYLISIALLLLLAAGCSVTTFNELNERNPEWLVVDGWMTNHPEEHLVFLSRTQEFGNTTTPPGVDDATILVFTETNIVTLNNLGHGWYATPIDFALEPANAYRFEVRTDSSIHEYRTVLPGAITVSDLQVDTLEEGFEGWVELEGDPNTVAYVFPRIYALEEIDGDTLETELGQGIRLDEIASITFDEFGFSEFNWELEDAELPANTELVRIEIHSVNAELVNYLTNLQQDVSGDLFSPYAANPPAMFDNEALGVVFNSTMDWVVVELED